MDWFVGPAIVVMLGVAMLGLVLMAKRIRRRGAAGQAIATAMAAFDEGFHSTAHETFVETRAQDERSQQAPSPRERHR